MLAVRNVLSQRATYLNSYKRNNNDNHKNHNITYRMRAMIYIFFDHLYWQACD